MSFLQQAVFGVLLIAVAAGAQTAPPPPTVRPATIEGFAKNQKNGEPLADVRVTVTPELVPAGLAPAGAPPPATATRSATTDGEGRFTITGVPPGRYTLTATRTLFFRPRRNTGAMVVTVAADQRLRDVQILLMPTGVIAGRVVDENRDPMRSVRIEAVRSEYRNGVRIWLSSGNNTTDDRGEYRVFNLQPGTYYIRATPSGGINSTPPLYYPGVPDSQDASPIQIEAGSELGAIDVIMRRVTEYSVQFKIGGVPPGSVVNLTVQKQNSKITESNILARPVTLPDNAYRIERLAPGAYDIVAQISTPTTVQPRVITHAGKIPVLIGRGDEDLGTVSVRATVPVTGRIVQAEPLPSTIDLKRLTLTLTNQEGTPAMNAFARGSANPPGFNDDGTFTMPNVAAGRYQIQLTGLPADTYLVGARSAGKELLDAGYTVSGDQGPLEVVIGGAASVGVIEGTVVNSRGDPMPGSAVVLVPAGERRNNPSAYRNVFADQHGNFSLRSVLAGEYKILAWEDVEPGAYMDPDFLKDFETRGEAVRVQRGSQNTVSVRVIPAS
jgi:hypothetical protein